MYTMQMKLKLMQVMVLLEAECAQYCAIRFGAVILIPGHLRHDGYHGG